MLHSKVGGSPFMDYPLFLYYQDYFSNNISLKFVCSMRDFYYLCPQGYEYDFNNRFKEDVSTTL